MMSEENSQEHFPINCELLFEKNSQALQIPKETYINIVKASIQESSQDIGSLEACINGGDHAKIQPIAHRIKGVFFNLQLLNLAVPAQEIDQLAKDQGDMNKMHEQYAILKEAFQSLKSSIESAM